MDGDISVKAAWNENVLQKLIDLWTSQEGADVNIHVGNKNIPTHKLVIGINSEILKVGDTVNDAKNNMTEVFIEQEFEENADLIENIIRSFYTGAIIVENEDLKLTYKFATHFSVKWLMEYVLKRFQVALNEKTFLDIYTFANIVGCETLKIMCLDYVDIKVANKLIESGDLMGMNFHCIRRFTLLDNPGLSEIKIFEIISKWFEHDVDNRKCHIESLLFNIRFQLIQKDDLVDPVQNWIMDTEGIDDKVRFQLIKAVNKQIINDTNTCAQEPRAQSGNKSVYRQAEVGTLMHTLTDFVNKKGTAKQKDCKRLSSEEFATVVRERFSKSDINTKHLILEYLSDNQHLIKYSITITEFTKLPEFETSDKITRLIKKATNYYQNIESVLCEELSYDILHKFLSKTVNWSTPLIWLYVTEGIMEWGRSHPEEVNKVRQLLLTAVCACPMPNQYKDMIVLPYLRQLLQNRNWQLPIGIGQLPCMMHDGEPGCKSPRCYVKALSEEMYLLKNMAELLIIQCNDSNRFIVRLDTTAAIPLQIQHYYRDQYGSWNLCTSPKYKFILFDKQQCMDRYPTYTEGNLTLIELRELFIKYSDLHVMTFLSS